MLWLAAAVSGLLLSLADYPLHAWPLGIVALVPFLIVLSRPMTTRRAANAAVVFAVAYALPLALALRFPFTLALGQVLVVTAVWTISWTGAARALRLGPLAGPIVAAAFMALVEWANFTLIPIWGTAQCFVRTWSAWPPAVQSVSFWGMSGLVFQVVAVQALAVSAARTRAWRPLALAGVLLLVPLGLGVATVRAEAARSDGPVVAAIGWLTSSLDTDEIVDKLIVPNVHAAAAQGAELVVTPEVGLMLGAVDEERVLARLGALAAAEHVRLAIGWYDLSEDRNHVSFIDRDGRLGGEYTKTHLIPFVERYHAGDGSQVVDRAAGATTVGTMICQDDNFTDLARAYGRRATPLVAVPTHDWREVAPYHLENSLFRAIENRYALVRAGMDATSVIASPTGRVLARRDPFVEGAGLIVARVPLSADAPTLYARFDWPPLAWVALIGFAALRARRRARGASSLTGSPRPGDDGVFRDDASVLGP